VRLFFVCALAAAGLALPAAGSAALPQITQYDALLVSRTDPSSLLLGTQHGLFRSTDGGRSWRTAGFTGHAVTSLAQVGTRILAGGHGLLVASGNGGRSWHDVKPRGLPNEQVDALGSNGSTVYVVLTGAGLYRSRNDARTFRSVSLAVGPAIRALALSGEQILAGDVSTGVYLSPNGREWLHTAHGAIMALAVGGAHHDGVLAASWGIARSSDGGRRWSTALRSHVRFGAVAWAPGHPSLAYAVADDRSFWRSTDAGHSWHRVG
jgi:photosystem II stability/assembly factor-like uncharacterized protein